MDRICDLCQNVIREGDAHHTINFHTERLHGNVCTVDHAEELMVTCISCGTTVHRDAIKRVLSTKDKDKARFLGEILIPMEVK